MKLSQCQGSFGACIIDLFTNKDGTNERYGGWQNYRTRQKMLIKLSNLGASFIRTSSMPGFFEREFTDKGGKEYKEIFPICGGQTKVNDVWLAAFRGILAEIKTANLLPYIFLVGGCDYPASRNVLLDPRREDHWPALRIYMKTVVRELKAMFGVDFLLETGNELYVMLGSEQYGADIQVRMADYLYSIGVPYGQIRLSGLDGGHKITCAEYLQVAAFGPENLDDVTDPVQRKKFYSRKGLDETGTKVIANRLGISLHEVGYPSDVARDGTAGRASINGYANYQVRRFGPMAYSNDGVGWNGSEYKGNSAAELPAVYKAVYPDLVHGLSGGIGTFEDLPQDERTWTQCSGIPANKYVKSMNFGPKFEAHFKALAKAYKELTGKEPHNKANPVTIEAPKPDEPDVPVPVEPSPVEPEPDKEEYVKLIHGLFDWHVKEWWAQFSTKKKVWIVWLALVHLYGLIHTLVWML